MRVRSKVTMPYAVSKIPCPRSSFWERAVKLHWHSLFSDLPYITWKMELLTASIPSQSLRFCFSELDSTSYHWTSVRAFVARMRLFLFLRNFWTGSRSDFFFFLWSTKTESSEDNQDGKDSYCRYFFCDVHPFERYTWGYADLLTWKGFCPKPNEHQDRDYEEYCRLPQWFLHLNSWFIYRNIALLTFGIRFSIFWGNDFYVPNHSRMWKAGGGCFEI